jgi:hypothetical protein
MPFAIPLSLAAQRSARTNSSLPPDPLGARAADLGSVSDIVAAQDVPALGGGRFVCARVRDGVLLRQDAPELPDVLAYWTAADASVTALPADARLLGKLDGAPRRFPHPGGSGQVIFYSLAHGAVVASWRVSGN